MKIIKSILDIIWVFIILVSPKQSKPTNIDFKTLAITDQIIFYFNDKKSKFLLPSFSSTFEQLQAKNGKWIIKNPIVILKITEFFRQKEDNWKQSYWIPQTGVSTSLIFLVKTRYWNI